MGSPPVELVEAFVLGDKCNACEDGPMGCLLPDLTPLYTKATIYDAGVEIDNQICKQDPDFPCEWGDLIIGDTRMWLLWTQWAPAGGNSYFSVHKLIGVHWTMTFDSRYLGLNCRTSFPNMKATPPQVGDQARITWGPEIDEAAYLAQFP